MAYRYFFRAGHGNWQEITGTRYMQLAIMQHELPALLEGVVLAKVPMPGVSPVFAAMALQLLPPIPHPGWPPLPPPDL